MLEHRARSEIVSPKGRWGSMAQIGAFVLMLVAVVAADRAYGDKKSQDKTPSDKHQPKRGVKSEKIRTKYFLTAREIEKAVAPFVDEITACYKRFGTKQRRSTGALRIELVIHPSGNVHHLTVVAPGVKGKRLDRCGKKVVKQWRFPPKKRFTTAVVPFFFLRTKGAKPLRSCWNPKGCPKERQERRQSR